jgi:hypothetical protein
MSQSKTSSFFRIAAKVTTKVVKGTGKLAWQGAKGAANMGVDAYQGAKQGTKEALRED